MNPPPLPEKEHTELERLLPVVRELRAAGAVARDSDQDVLGLYIDRVIIFRKQKSHRLSANIFDSGGNVPLSRIRAKGRRIDWPWSDVAAVAVSRLQFYGSRWLRGVERGYQVRITAADGGYADVWIPEDDAEHVLVALRGLLADRDILREDMDIPRRPATGTRLTARYSPALRRTGALLGAMLVCIAVAALLNEDFTPLFGGLAFLLGLGAFIFFSLLAARGASDPESHYLKQRHAERHRLKRSQADLSRRRPWWSPPIGMALKAAGGVLLAVQFCSFIWVVHHLPGDMPPPVRQLLDVANSILFLPATCLIYYGYRLGLRPAEQVRQEDPRSPILYLRSFEHDGRTSFNPTGFTAQLFGLEPIWLLKWLGPLGNVNPIRLVRLLFSRSADHAEEQLAEFFKHFGPFVAIGRPGERIALGGAARFYLADDEWQDTVLRLMREASMIVLQPGPTEHVWWEIHRSFEYKQPRTILFSLQSCDGSQARYEQFRIRFEREIGIALPRMLGDAAFLHIGTAGAQMLPPHRRWHFTWPLAGCAIDFRKTLSPFLAACNGAFAPIISPPSRVLRGFSAIAAMGIWSVLLSTPYFLGGLGFKWVADSNAAATFAEEIQNPAARIAITGPPDMPYRFELTRGWKEMSLPDEIRRTLPYGASLNFQIWTLADVAACTLTSVPRSDRTARTNRALIDGALEGMRPVHTDLRIVEERVRQQAGRDWAEVAVDATVPASLLPQDGTQMLYRFSGRVRYTIRGYAGPEGAIIFITAAKQTFADRLAAGFDQMFATFTFESPAQRALEAGETQRLERLRNAQSEISALLDQWKQRTATTPFPFGSTDLSAVLSLRKPWMKSSQRLTRFAFGAAASFDAFSVSVLPGTSVEAVAAEQRSKLENQGGVPLQNLQTQLLQENSMTWSESRFEAAVNGERRLLLQRVALVADEAVVLQVSTFPELEETLAPVLREAIGSFQSVPRTERELAVASHLEHGRETKVHRGTAAPYTLTAGALWSPISVPLGSPYDLLLQLGNGDHAWVGVVCEPRDAFSDQVDAEAIAGVMIEAIRSANSDSFELRGHDWIQFAGQRSLRLRYSIALFGNRLQFTNHILLHPRYVFQCVGFTDFESADAHDNALSPALNGFRLPASTEGR